jgi:hypothetical protein
MDGAAYDTAIGDNLDLIKAAPGAIWSAAKAFPGFYKGYLKFLWKIAQLPSKMAGLTAQAVATGDANPLKDEIDKIVRPVATTYEQAMEYRSMLTILCNEPEVYELLYDFADRYYEATHPIELAKMGTSAVTEVLITVLLAIFTAGAGAAANIAAKSGKLIKVFNLLKKITATIKKISPNPKLLDRSKDAAAKAKKTSKATTRSTKGMPDVDSPNKTERIDKTTKKEYGDDKDDGPKTTTKKKQTGARELDYWDFDGAEKSYDAIRAAKGDVSKISKNTGMKEFQVKRIKDHLFNKKHQLDDGVRRFDADPQIANAWKRLEGGNFTDKDVQLLKHELFESKFEGIFKVDYRTAHSAANRAGRLSGLE